MARISYSEALYQTLEYVTTLVIAALVSAVLPILSYFGDDSSAFPATILLYIIINLIVFMSVCFKAFVDAMHFANKQKVDNLIFKEHD